MNIVHALQEKKCTFYTILHSEIYTTTDLGIVYMLWEEKLGGFIYLHRMKIRLAFFGIALFFYQRYEALFHSTINNHVSICDRDPVENIYIHSHASKINSLIKAIKNPTNPVFFSRLPWGKIMCCREFNTLLITNTQSVCCIEYSISPSFFLSTIEREEQDIQDDLEKEKYTTEQNDSAILSSLAFKNM